MTTTDRTAGPQAATAEEKLVQERTILQYIVDNIPYLIFWKDRDSTFLGCNKNFAIVSGFSDPKELIGKTDLDLASRECADEYRAFDRETMDRGEPIIGKEERMPRPQGGDMAILTSKVPLRNEAGEVIGILGMIVDITERKRSEEELRRAKEAAEQATRARSEFIANVSHELRTPLTLILGPVKEALRDPAMPSGMRQLLERVLRNGFRLYNLVNSVLDFAKAEAGRTSVRRDVLDVVASIRSVVEDMQPLARSRGIELRFSTTVEQLAAALDLKLVERILLNLVGNALKFTSAGGWVRVDLALEGDSIRIEITDNGIGIPKDVQQHLFRPFAQLDSSATRKHEGTGLGLALVKQFAEAQGGSVRVSSEEGVGSTFTVLLPMQRVGRSAPTAAAALADESDLPLGSRSWQHQVANMAAPSAAAAPSRAPRPSQSPDEPDERPRVLVAEDNPDLRSYIGDILGEKFAVTAVENGRLAWERLQTHRFDLVISDVMMPELDGLGLIGRIKSHAALAQLPVILLTARGGAEATASGLEVGADDYLAKPFEAEELSARARAAVRMSRLQEELRIKSRRAGMTSVADGILHNLGNVLNSISVSCSTISEGLQRSRIGGVERLAALLADHRDDLAAFLTSDDRGRQIPAYVSLLASGLVAERESLGQEMARLQEGIKHVENIVGSHQTIGRSEGLVELFAPVEVTETALRLSLPSTESSAIQLERRLEDVPLLRGDKHKVLQILINLITNANESLQQSGRANKVLRLATERLNGSVRFTVSDNGVGIAPAVKTSLFRQGFSTKESGRGLGLHSSAILAKQLGGSLTAESEGEGRGAAFVLELPLPAEGARDASAPLPHD